MNRHDALFKQDWKKKIRKAFNNQRELGGKLIQGVFAEERAPLDLLHFGHRKRLGKAVRANNRNRGAATFKRFDHRQSEDLIIELEFL